MRKSQVFVQKVKRGLILQKKSLLLKFLKIWKFRLRKWGEGQFYQRNHFKRKYWEPQILSLNYQLKSILLAWFYKNIFSYKLWKYNSNSSTWHQVFKPIKIWWQIMNYIYNYKYTLSIYSQSMKKIKDSFHTPFHPTQPPTPSNSACRPRSNVRAPDSDGSLLGNERH